MIESALISVILGSITVGLFGALKFYSNTLGNNPESFDLKKFAPIMIVGISFSIIMALTGNVEMTAQSIGEFISANFILVIFVNTIITILLKKLYPSTPN
jgi:hypothetical protein